MTRKEEIVQASDNYYNEVKYLSDLSAFPIAAFKAGAKWADKTMLDRVCEWLKCNLPYSSKPPYQVIEDLRKAMEKE